MNVLADLEKFLTSEIAAAQGKSALTRDEDLIMQGIIDSLGILKLVTFMETRFNIKIANDEIVPENFQTLDALNAFVEKKRAG